MTEVRRLGPDDVEACAALSASRGWGPTVDKWRALLSSIDGWGIDHPDGGLAATVTHAGYRDHSVLGMMLVAPDCEGRGLARRLCGRVVEGAAGRPVALYATPQGEPVYERLGFTRVSTVHVLLGRRPASGDDGRAGVAEEPALDRAALATVLDREDARLAGRRRGVLAALAGLTGARAIGADDGQVMAWPMDGALLVGPVLAGDESAAARLCVEVASGWPGTFRVDVPDEHPGLVARLVDLGLREDRNPPLMVLGDPSVLADAPFAIASQGLG